MFFLSSLSFFIIPFAFAPDFGGGVTILLLTCCLTIILCSAFAYFWAELTYQNWKYELAEEGFKKESGVIWKKYVTIPYDRIQNVDIYRGLISRVIGLSDLQVQTAGFSSMGQYGAGAEGRLPGLSATQAEEIRDQLILRAKRQ